MSDPYCYPGTNVLINKLNIRDNDALYKAEELLYSAKSAEPLPKGNFDYNHLKAIHKHFFGDLYEWAGKERTVDIVKGNSYFAHNKFIESEVNKQLAKLKNENFLQGTDKTSFCKQSSCYFNEINAAHPFREGNGRTLRAFFDLLTEQAGYKLNWDKVKVDEYIQASIAGFNGKNEAMEKVFNKIAHSLELKRSVSTVSVKQTKEKNITKNDSEVDKVVKKFAELDKNLKKAEKQPYAAARVYASEQVNKYAIEVGRNQKLMEKLQARAPKLKSRVVRIMEREHEIEL